MNFRKNTNSIYPVIFTLLHRPWNQWIWRFFLFFAVFWQLKIEIENLIPITSIIIHLLYTQSPHDGLCKIRIGRNQIYMCQFLNEKIFILAKMCVFSRKCVIFNGLCRKVKTSRYIEFVFFLNSKHPYYIYTISRNFNWIKSNMTQNLVWTNFYTIFSFCSKFSNFL